MKHILLTLLLSTIALVLMAQTGLYDISYEQSRQELNAALKSEGFRIDEETDWMTQYSNPEYDQLDKIVVVFSDGKVSRWTVYYNPDDRLELFDELKDILTDMHGEPDEWDIYSNGWLIGNNNAVIMELDTEKQQGIKVHYENDWDFFYDYYEYYGYWW